MTTPQIRQRHADLIERMANALGLDLDERIMQGGLDIESLDDAVLRCTLCSDPEGCEHWVSAQQDEAPAAPEMCRNLALFQALKQGRRV